MSEYTLTQIDFLNVIQGIQNNPQFSIFWLSLFVFKSLSSFYDISAKTFASYIYKR